MTSTPGCSGNVLVDFASQSGGAEWLIDRNSLLLVTGRRGRSDEKNLVRHKCSVRYLLGGRIDDIAGSERNLFRCDFHHRNICRHGDRLGAILILDYQGSTAAFLYC